ncbi:MAG: DUF885 domain-containing protein [Lachnospiraceae bacterium]|nr:DUF885 domain-containing protein [Lachnospiraceae bacterium]
MRSKRFLSLALAACVAVSSAGCVTFVDSYDNKKAESDSAAETKKDTEKEETAPAGNSGKVTLHHAGDDDESKADKKETEGSTKEEKETRPVEDENESLAEKYRRLLKMSSDEAREYFDVKIDTTLTPKDFDEYLNDLFLDYVPRNYMDIQNYFKDPTSAGVDLSEFEYDLGSVKKRYEPDKELYDWQIEDLKTMLAFDESMLDNRQQLVFDKLYYEDIFALWDSECINYTSTLSVNGGILPNLAMTFYEYKFYTEDDLKNYGKVLEYLPGIIREIPDSVREDVEKLGIYPSDESINDTITTITALIDTDNNPFIDAYNEKVDSLGLAKDTADSYKKQNESFYVNEVIPALKDTNDEIKEFLGKNPLGTPLCNSDAGYDYYEYLAELQVGAIIDVKELFELIDKDFKKNLQTEFDCIENDYYLYDDYYEGNLGLGKIEKMQPEDMIDFLKEEMADEFPELDKTVTYDVTPLPKSLEIDGLLAYYNIPPLDASDVNIIRYNSSGIKNDTLEMYASIAHEGYPGHMLYFNLMQEKDAYNVEHVIYHLGVTEGWAVHAALLAIDRLDVQADLKTLIKADKLVNYEIIALADIACNGLGWSVQRFEEYLFGMGITVPGIGQDLYDVAIKDPSGYLPYSAGYILVKQLFDELEKEGMDKKEMYERFCSIGPVSFDVLEEYMRKDI